MLRRDIHAVEHEIAELIELSRTVGDDARLTTALDRLEVHARSLREHYLALKGTK